VLQLASESYERTLAKIHFSAIGLGLSLEIFSESIQHFPTPGGKI
jgi:hypothetical protein